MSSCSSSAKRCRSTTVVKAAHPTETRLQQDLAANARRAVQNEAAQISANQQMAGLERMILAGLQGSTATLRLVVDQSLINESIAANLVPRYPALTDVRLAIGADNQVAVRVRSNMLLASDVTLHLEIDRVAILDPALALRFRIRKQGLSQIVAWVLPTIAHKLPPFVKLSGEDVVVELATLVPERWRPMLVLLEKLAIETSPGKLHVGVELRA